MYVDASVIVAVLLEEAGFEQFGKPLTGHGRRFTSPLAIYEATVALVRVRGVAVDVARTTVLHFLARGGISVEPHEAAHADEALAAFDRFGKGRHPAALNMGDCFAYAAAQLAGAAILFKGDDFAKTDLPSALSAS
jgi:ribonuclease VapC